MVCVCMAKEKEGERELCSGQSIARYQTLQLNNSLHISGLHPLLNMHFIYSGNVHVYFLR